MRKALIVICTLALLLSAACEKNSEAVPAIISADTTKIIAKSDILPDSAAQWLFSSTEIEKLYVSRTRTGYGK